MKQSRHSKNTIILSASSDIGVAFARSRLRFGDSVVGTYRNSSQGFQSTVSEGLCPVYCDFSDYASVDEACKKISSFMDCWDHLMVATGCLEPIGNFQDVSFDKWSDSLHINFINPLRAVQALLALRSPSNSSVLFFAGSGTNGPADMFSAYTCSKIALIKMVELLDSEIKDVAFTILGPGWIDTKIHSQTLSLTDKSTPCYVETHRRTSQGHFGSMDDLIDCINWIFTQERSVISGRNIAFQYDSWRGNLDSLLRGNTELGKLRRFGNDLLSNEH